ncbi:hypothetical protein AB4175_24175, partial [Vibrio cyclitrophicus]
ILTSKLIFIALSKKIDEHVILKLLPFQQNGNELTVPKLSKLNFVLVTQFIEIKFVTEVTVLSKRIKRFDIHQRVPTQIDRFKLLKSFSFLSFAQIGRPF